MDEDKIILATISKYSMEKGSRFAASRSCGSKQKLNSDHLP